MNTETIALLRSDLQGAEYTLNSVRALLGEEADSARERGVLAPATRVLGGLERSPLQVMIRCFLLGDQVTSDDLNHAFPALLLSGLRELQLVKPAQDVESHSAYVAALSLNPVSITDSIRAEPFDWWLISDLDDHLRRGPAYEHHVMGVGGATRSLISQAPTNTVTRALDLGTGCGVVALHLSLRGKVVATDISERALLFARANAALNDVDSIDFRLGNLFEPVADDTFDLILSNPPFVVTPRTIDTTYEYRDAGMVGDALAELVLREGVNYLAPGGTLLCLANWESPWGIDGATRVTGWIDAAAEYAQLYDTQIASWVIERDRVSPIRYAETWARDGGARPGEVAFDDLLIQWIDDFAARKIVALGLGSIRVQRLFAEQLPTEKIRHMERSGGGFSPQPGIALQQTFDAGIAVSRMSDTEILKHHWYLVPGVEEERVHQPGAEAPRSLTLVSTLGIERRVVADPLLAAAVGACDGDLTLAQIAGALATLLEVDEDAASEALVGGVRELVWMGMLTPWVPTTD